MNSLMELLEIQGLLKFKLVPWVQFHLWSWKTSFKPLRNIYGYGCEFPKFAPFDLNLLRNPGFRTVITLTANAI